jgi:uroporphyrin-III C-methyltransferase/precorrin-2 dehydrogenase/sirohydrochlorin ferrochelatase
VTRKDASAAIGTLDELPDLVEKIAGGPAVLIIGDVVAHAAPSRHQELTQLASYFQVAAE